MPSITSDWRHYVPIVRWRKAEIRALKELLEPDIRGMTPLVEIPPNRFEGRYDPASGKFSTPPKERVLETILNQVGELGLVQPCFLDFGGLDRCGQPFLVSGRSPWETATALLESVPSDVIPVFRIFRHNTPHLASIANFVSSRGRRACLRLQEVDLDLKDLAPRVDRLLARLALEASDVHLVVDLGVTYEQGKDFTTVCSLVPRLDEWRSFTIASGYFPMDLQGFDRGREHLLRRADLQRWGLEVAKSLPRRPSFGDYTVQHAVYVPPPDVILHPSASIRYALSDSWLILRGEDYTREGGPGKAQWIGWAQLLCSKAEFGEFGPTFSAGDAFVYNKSINPEDPGEGTDWLFAAINHHMTLTKRQVASFRAA